VTGPIQRFDDFSTLRASHPTGLLERITGVQTYAEQNGECKGLQLVYNDGTTKNYIHIDEYQNIALTEEFTVPAGEYISDVQVSVNRLDKKAKLRTNDDSEKRHTWTAQEKEFLDTINVKFILTDGSEYTCGSMRGTPSWVSLIPQIAGQDNTLLYLGGAHADNSGLPDGYRFPNDLKLL
jgi:hypothetical protein